VRNGRNDVHHARLAEFAHGDDGDLLQLVDSESEGRRFVQVVPVNDEPYLITTCDKHGALRARWSDVLAALGCGGGTVVAIRMPDVRSGALSVSQRRTNLRRTNW
jgi:hypothetical protein